MNMVTVWVLLLMAQNPEGAIHTDANGQFASEEACKEAFSEFVNEAKLGGLPAASVAGACVPTPFKKTTNELSL